MRKVLLGFIVVFALLKVGAYAQAAKTVTCVGLYSETDAGTISYRVGTRQWTVIKVGDKIPANAEIRINVDRDWVEVSPAGNPNAVYEITGPESGERIVKLVDLLKQKPKTVSFQKGTAAKPDPQFKDKLVVTEYLGRQIYMESDGSRQDIKYGDVLDSSGRTERRPGGKEGWRS
jgi:hypothetical protein